MENIKNTNEEIEKETIWNTNIEAKKVILLFVLLDAIAMLSVSFFAAIFFLFLEERGLSISEISAVAFVAIIITLIFEIPTGVIADACGRKISYICSCFLMAMGLFTYMISDSLLMFLIGATFVTISKTLSNGAFKAWLVDSLNYHNCLVPLNNIEIKNDQVSYSFAIVGVLIGSFLADKNVDLPWIASILTMLLVGVIAIIFMKEEYSCEQKLSFAKKVGSEEGIIETSIKCARKNKAIEFLLLVGLLQSFAIQAPLIQYQLFFSELLPNKTALGFLWSAAAIFTIVGTTLSSKLLLKLENNHKKTLALSQIGIGLGILLLGILPFPFSLLAFLFWKLAMGTFGPISSEYLNENIPLESRATLISFEAMAFAVGAGIGLIFSGLISHYFSIPTMWIILGGILIISTILLMKNGNHKIENEAT